MERIPTVYDALMALVERGRLRRWREWLVRGVRGRVLEIGCGTGRNLPFYPPGTPVIATDPHLELLAAARRRAPRALLVQARAEALPFKDGAFDTAVAALVLCSVDDPAAGLAELRRVLAGDGTLRLIEHVRARERWLAQVQDAVQRPWTWLTGGCRPNRETEAAVTAAGFRIEPEGRRASGVMRRFTATR